MNKTIKRLLLFTPRNYPIYGVSWDKGANPVLTRTDASVGMTAGVAVDSAFSRNDFDGVSLFSEIHEITDTYGNKFIRIPKCYIGKTDGVGFKTWQVSKTHYPGFYRPACFWDFTNNRELPYVDVGKYKATKDGGNKLESKPALYPLVLNHIVNFRTYAQANNTGGLLGYQLLDVHVVDLLRTLMFIELATLNTQTVMQGFTTGYYGSAHVALIAESSVNRIIITNTQGALYRVGQTISIHLAAQSATPYNLPNTYGRTIVSITADTPGAGQTEIVFDGAAINVALNDFVMNTGWKNGFSSAIAASSGSIGSNSDGKYPCVYRGIESIFGDLYQWVDGININELQAWVCANADDYASNVFASPYEQISYVNHNVDGCPITMGWDSDHPYANFPASVGGSSSTYYSNYYYQTTGQRVAPFGGSWVGGTAAGPSLWALVYSSSSTSVFIGGRLVKKAL